MFVEVVQVNVTWISSDDGDQYLITREEIHDHNRIFVQAANNKQENLSRHDLMVVSKFYWWVLHSFGILSVSVLLCPVVLTEDTHTMTLMKKVFKTSI